MTYQVYTYNIDTDLVDRVLVEAAKVNEAITAAATFYHRLGQAQDTTILFALPADSAPHIAVHTFPCSDTQCAISCQGWIESFK